MITHPPFADLPVGPFVFGELDGVSCSVCAPAGEMTEEQAIAFAETYNACKYGRWRSVNKEKLGIGFKETTPEPCNHDATRIHWFLLTSNLVEALELASERKSGDGKEL
jgi:hypothetical protein